MSHSKPNEIFSSQYFDEDIVQEFLTILFYFLWNMSLLQIMLEFSEWAECKNIESHAQHSVNS